MNAMANRMWVALVLAGLTAVARGGDLDSPAEPTSAGSAMFTLNDIWNKLNDRSNNVTLRTGVFSEPIAAPGATGHTLNEIMTLVTNRAPVAKTGWTTSYAVNDDGDLKKGVAWPNPRFTVGTGGEATNCVTDNLTGLMWARNANFASNLTLGAWSSVGGTCTWFQAVDVITNPAGPVNGANGGAGYGGYNDWRMPNIRELHSLIDYRWGLPAVCNTAGNVQWTEGNPFINGSVLKGANRYYWSSTHNVSTYVW